MPTDKLAVYFNHMTTILDGKNLSKKIIADIKLQVAQLKTKPGLAVVLVGNDPASQIYVNNKEKACHEVGFYSEKIVLPDTVSPQDLFQTIERLNHDPKIHGILCQFPLPQHLRHLEETLTLSINPLKDVDGFHPLSRLISCTPKGIMRILSEYHIETSGKHAVVLGRSSMVGKPVAQLLLNADATVTITHSKTKNLSDIVRQADIIVAAIGKPKFVTADMVKPGSVIIDVGINRTEAGLVGDVDFEAVKEIVQAITPVPGGIGPMTIAMLMDNVLSAYNALQVPAALQTTAE